MNCTKCHQIITEAEKDKFFEIPRYIREYFKENGKVYYIQHRLCNQCCTDWENNLLERRSNSYDNGLKLKFN